VIRPWAGQLHRQARRQTNRLHRRSLTLTRGQVPWRGVSRDLTRNQCYQVGLGVVTQGEQAASPRIAR
jgi:hypothetical protein